MTLQHVTDALKSAKHVVVMTGAGVSAESGIPTFRDALEGYWSKYDPTELATPEAFQRDAELVSRWYDERRMKVLACDPNPGHIALAAMEAHVTETGGSFTLLTQNVDGLHVRSGSQNVIEVHGSLTTWRCTVTGKEFTDMPTPLESYPTPTDEGLLRPGVVWFGEALPMKALQAAGEALSQCEVYLAIGTSGVVFPAAGFVSDAKAAGAKTFELNLQKTPMTSYFDTFVEGKSGEVLPEIASQWFGYSS